MRTFAAIGLMALCLSSAAKPCQACSNFLFNKNGYSLVAHNNDWVTGDGLVVINKRHVEKRGFQVENTPEFRWTSTYGSVSLTFDGRESTGRGMNEAGLVILEAALGATQQSRDHGLPLLSVAQWTQYQLDTSATIADVIASDKVVRIWPDDMQSHFFLSDKSGAVAVIEWLDGEMKVYRDSTLPVPAIVNSTYESCLANGDDPTGRFKKLVDGLAAATASDGLDYVYSILRDVSNAFPPPTRTLWSVVFDMRTMRLYLSTDQNSSLRYLDLKDFDFSCQTNVEVLDINGPGAGNVRSAFVPYTTALNSDLVKHTYDVYRSYGYAFAEETINQVIAFPDSTRCVDGDLGGTGGASASGGTGGTLSGMGGTGGMAGSGGQAGRSTLASDGGTGGAITASGGSPVGGGAAGCACALGGHGFRGIGAAGLLGLGILAWQRRTRRQ